MIFWIPFSFVLFVVIGWSMSTQKVSKIPVFINGLIPSLPNAETKEEKGSTVYIVYTDKASSKGEKEIYRGYADDKGRVMAFISSKNVGRSVMIRHREDGFKPDEFETTVQNYGIIKTVKLEKDEAYSGKIRGKEITDLQKHYEDAMAYAELPRKKFILASEKLFGQPFARIRVEFWLISYFVFIIAFALDYWNNTADFKDTLDSFVHALYFSVVTITTLGYGDSHPTTDLLRIACSLEAILGVFIVGFALNSLFRGPREIPMRPNKGINSDLKIDVHF